RSWNRGRPRHARRNTSCATSSASPASRPKRLSAPYTRSAWSITSSANASSSPARARRISSCSEVGAAFTAPLYLRRPRLRAPERLVLVQLERAGVDAVTLARRARTVREHVAEMPATSGAGHLDPVHAVAAVVVKLDVRPVGRLGEAGPTGTGIELRLGREQLGATARTAVC